MPFLSRTVRVLGLMLVLTLVTAHPVGAIDTAEEYEIKAVYLFNLGQFVYWPDTILPDGATFRVCILGRDPFGRLLDFVVDEVKVIQQHPIQVRRINNTKQSKGCHILFISSSEERRLPYIFEQLRNEPILLVSDIERFVTQGGMVQFYQLDTKIRLMLDPDSFSNARLKPSAQLMRIAKNIKQ